MNKDEMIPQQKTGAESNTAHSVELENMAQAQQVFMHARSNLLQVNKWHELAGKATATFQLTDTTGNNVDREARTGDYFKIKIPGPDNAKAEYDWVRVESVEEQIQHNFYVWTTIKVRPAAPPQPNTQSTAHFFSEQATSSFIVERKGLVVTASVLGRNEKVNEQSQGWADTMRNAIVAFAAMIGLNKPQWKSLVKGILDDSSKQAHHQQ